jgi:cobyrinic acid a,c-diamide synthase
MAGSVDLDRLLALARSAPSLVTEAWAPDQQDCVGPPPLIALTTGYGYPETAELLVAAGAEVVGVDPLRDEELPSGTAGLVIGGGLPESYLDELAANETLARSVAALAAAGRPVVAEGAGLAWLCREFDGRPMCGVVDATGRTSEHVIIGYREATVRSVSPHLSLGSRVVGYKQHVGLVSPRAGEQPAWSWPGGQPEGFVSGGVHASYLCLHWAGVPQIAERLVAAARAVPGGPWDGEPGTTTTMRLAS